MGADSAVDDGNGDAFSRKAELLLGNVRARRGYVECIMLLDLNIFRKSGDKGQVRKPSQPLQRNPDYKGVDERQLLHHAATGAVDAGVASSVNGSVDLRDYGGEFSSGSASELFLK